MRLQLHAEDSAGLVKKRKKNQLPTITKWHWLLNLASVRPVLAYGIGVGRYDVG